MYIKSRSSIAKSIAILLFKKYCNTFSTKYDANKSACLLLLLLLQYFLPVLITTLTTSPLPFSPKSSQGAPTAGSGTDVLSRNRNKWLLKHCSFYLFKKTSWDLEPDSQNFLRISQVFPNSCSVFHTTAY